MRHQPRALFRLPWRTARQIGDDFEDELAFHHEMRIAELIAAGATPDDARELAAQEFGDLDDARRYVRAVDRATEAAERRREGVRAIGDEISHVARRLRRAPAFTATAVLTLALGIGACTLMFNIVSSILLSPLPFTNPERVAMIWGYMPQMDLGFAEQPVHGRYFTIIRDEAKAFGSIAAFRAKAFNLGDATAPERLDGVEATGEFFNAIGTRPAIGRFFARENETAGSDRVVVLSDALWRRRFGADPTVVGHIISLNNEPFTIIGVAASGFAFPRGAEMPGDFQFPARPDLWVPLSPPTRGPSDLALIGRMAPGIGIDAARADMDRIRGTVERQIPQGKGSFGTMVVPLRTQLVGKTEPMLLSLLAAVGLLLVIACVNTAQLQLAQLQSRRRDIAVRAALGASRRRIASGLMIEVLALATCAGALGAALAWLGLGFVRTAGSAKLPRLAEASFDGRTAIVAVLATIGAGVLASLLPALLGSRIPLIETLRRGGRGLDGAGSSVRVRRILIVAELTISVVLVSCAGLLGRSLAQQLKTATGFSAPNGLTFEVTLPVVRYPEQQFRTSMDHTQSVLFFTAALEKLRAIPGVQAAAIGKPLPLSGAQEASVFVAEGSAPPATPSATPVAEYTVASADMFQALGTPMLAGRDFTAADRLETLPVVVVNQAMAKWLWPGQSGIGKRIKLGGFASPAPWMTVIGVSSDIKRYSLTETARPEMIVPYTQNPYPTFATMQFVVRSALSSAELLPHVRVAIGEVDPSIPVSRVRTIEDLVSETSANARFATGFMVAFGASALALAMIGLYGVITYGVYQRRQEFGIRRALGAAPRQIVGMVVGEGIGLAGVGLVAGALLSIAAGRALRQLLYQISAFDVATLAGTIGLLALATICACVMPAWRASRVEPRTALEET